MLRTDGARPNARRRLPESWPPPKSYTAKLGIWIEKPKTVQTAKLKGIGTIQGQGEVVREVGQKQIEWQCKKSKRRVLRGEMTAREVRNTF
jgi:hypothetical protein